MLACFRFLAALWIVLGSVFMLPTAAAREVLSDTVRVSDLPPEARYTLSLIRRGGPFPFAKDGSVFGNFERRLPVRPRGYYREYTVRTPGSRDRGARRIIAGNSPPNAVYYYTEDHYRSFRRIEE